jgi:DNA-binding LacI/PurR family transcriptional regulator
MATITDVAHLSGFSISTVSRVLSGKGSTKPKTAEAIQNAAEKLHYSPNLLAQSLKEGSTKTIAMVIPNINNPVFPAVAKGAEDSARKNGYQMFLCNTDESIETEQASIQLSLSRNVGGILLITAARENYYVDRMEELDVPLVVLVRDYGSHKVFDRVIVNNNNVGYLAGKALIKRGCRKGVIITGDTGLSLYQDRLDGFLNAFQEEGLEVPTMSILDGGHTDNNGYDVMEQFVSKGVCFDGVFASCDFQCLGVLKFLETHSYRVPQDVALVGVDNLNLCSLVNPSITSIHQPLYQCGYLACEKLIQRIQMKKNDYDNYPGTVTKLNSTLNEGMTT